ncbi:MAG: PAS domain S-box protein [Armatimonadetes bacterium]|nr:PAS domain S-box protein [Armatimonadota bacterium]
MALRRKALLTVVVAIAGLIAVIHVVSSRVLMRSFLALEEQHTRDAVQEALGSVSAYTAALDSKAGDWSSWDDTYRFIEDENPGFIQSNFTSNTFVELRVNLILLINARGRTVLARGFNLEATKEVGVPASLTRLLSAGSPLLRSPSSTTGLTGIVLLPEAPLLVASRPILTSEGTGPSRGTLIMGRYLDSMRIRRLAETTHLDLAFCRMGGAGSPGHSALSADCRAALTTLSEDRPVAARPLNRQLIAGYTVLKDVYHRPALLLRVKAERSIYRQGQATLRYLLGVLVVVGLLFIGSAMALVDKAARSWSAQWESERRYRALFDNSPISLWEEDASEVREFLEDLRRDGIQDLGDYLQQHPAAVSRCASLVKITDVNQATLRMYEAKNKEELLAGLSQVFGEESYEVFREEIVALAEGGIVFEREALNRTLTGRTINIVLNLTVAPGCEQTWSRILVSVLDVSDRKRAEEALQQGEERLRQVTDNIRDVFWLSRADLTGVLFVSPAYEELWGRTRESLYADSLSWTKSLHPEDRDRVLAAARTKQALGTYDEEYRIVRPDGSLRWIHDRAFPVPGESSVVERVAGIAEDVTQRKESEMEMQRRHRELAALHDISTAVSSTLDLSQILSSILENVLRVCRTDGATMGLLDPRTPDLTSLTTRERPRLSGTVMLLNEATGELEPFASRTHKGPQEASLRLRPGEGAAGWVAQRGQALVIPDVRVDGRFVFTRSPDREGVVCYAGFPLTTKGKVIGVLNLTSAVRHDFSLEEVTLLQTLCGSAAMALENARVHSEIQRRAEELAGEIAVQKRYAENVLRSIADGVYTVDAEDRVTSWNRGAEAILGYAAEEVLGKSCQEVFSHKDEQGKVLCSSEACPFAVVRRTGKPTTVLQGTARHCQGHGIAISVTVAPLLDDTGKCTGAVQVFRDVSRERELMESIQLANQAKSEFLANVSHELRTPLNGVLGFAQLLQSPRTGDLNERQQGYVAEIRQSGDHLLSLINDIIDLSHVATGKLQLELSEFPLPDLLRSTMDRLAKPARQKGIALFLEAADHVGMVQADERRVRQILENLLSNAVKFTPDGGKITVEAALRTGEREGGGMGDPKAPTHPLPHCPTQFIEVSVSDTGIGIAPEDLERIFHPLEQADSRYTRQYGGAGLGLALTKQLVELHGGRLWVESEVGKGSRFMFCLPQGMRR